ncbi:iron complex outermembrane receptor protein [Duganella sp. 1411]|uniref:TonB-dependent receptor plug domain-containing protein n=1 Tax=Duganella sp. 1411 TaxID=2806572 RepID=UPI001AE87E54|nr:TonB-dependent receptor [Duganella sp. 1411]MBP1203505.1 iron complex outermembrane receptor protein [Duganella sp. 1411]
MYQKNSSNGYRQTVMACAVQLALAAMLAAPMGNLHAQTSAAATVDSSVETVIVTGTRGAGAKARDSATPISVISADALQQTGASNLYDALTTVVPSYNSQSVGGDIGNMVRSVQLRGLGPNHVLVLVNGKRRHNTASIAADAGPNQYSSPADLDLIPVSAVDHIEVLQDGAAAQYGSDAIAGVVNVILKNSSSGGEIDALIGTYGDSKVNPHHEHNGLTRDVSLDQGFKLGGGGYAHLSAQVRDHDFTNQTGADLVTTSGFGTPLVPRSASSEPYPSRVAGDPRSRFGTVALNAGLQLDGGAEVYGFATAAHREAESWQNWRTPTKAPTFYPLGYSPLETTNENDYAVTAGIKGRSDSGWQWDLSSTYGRDDIAVGVERTVNRPLLRDTGSSPTRFHDGQYTFSQWTNNADVSKSLDMGWSAPLLLALGLEARRESYRLGAGDAASRYDFGPDGFAGYALNDAGTHSRNNYAAYVDVSNRPTPEWQLSFAGRQEHYSDFGNTFNGKLTSRYDFSQALALRATVSNGFRAPTLQEEYHSIANVGPTYADVVLPANSAAATLAGAKRLAPEKSRNVSVGLVAAPAPRLHLSLDAYQIEIRHRIIGSGTLSGAGADAAIVAHGSVLDPSITDATVSYLTNGVDTRTRGLDASGDYATDFGDAGKVKWTAGWNVNKNRITNVTLAGGLNPASASPIIDATPKNKLILNARYLNGAWNGNLRATRYGVTELTVADGDTGGAPYHTNHIDPTVIVDLESGYDVTAHLTLSAGAKNLLNRHPDKAISQGYSHAYVYPSFSPFGINGAYYYVKGSYTF